MSKLFTFSVSALVSVEATSVEEAKKKLAQLVEEDNCDEEFRGCGVCFTEEAIEFAELASW